MLIDRRKSKVCEAHHRHLTTVEPQPLARKLNAIPTAKSDLSLTMTELTNSNGTLKKTDETLAAPFSFNAAFTTRTDPRL